MMEDNVQGLLVGQVILAVIGALLLAVDDFAGYYYYNYYAGVEVWGYVSLGSGILGTILILIGIFGLLFSGYCALNSLRIGKKIKENAKKSMASALIVVVLSFVGALVFLIDNFINETQEYWLGAGFYSSFIGALLILYFGSLIKKR